MQSGKLFVLFLAVAAAYGDLPRAIWHTAGSVQWSPAGTMDTFQFAGAGAAAYVVISDSPVSGGVRLTYRMTLDNRRTGIYMCTAAVNASAPADTVDTLVTRFLTTRRYGNFSSMSSATPDMYCFEATAYQTHVCTTIYRYTVVDNPCGRTAVDRPTYSVDAAGDVFVLADATDPLLTIEMDANLNVSVTDSSTRVHRFALAVRPADQDRAQRLGGRLVMFGGNGTMSLKRLDRKSQSFDCEAAELPVALDYCIAPSMHLCRDYHIRAECRPPSNCSGHGNYSVMEHVCHCANNYDGASCERQECKPPCIYGDCNTNNGTCHCWPNAIGQTCDQYYIVSDEHNLTVSTGAILVLDGDNYSNYSVRGWLIIETGASLFVLLGREPLAAERVSVINFRYISGRFVGVHVSPLPPCIGYYVFYNQRSIELLFYSSCTEPALLTTPGYIIVGVVGFVVLVVVSYILLVRFSMRFRYWATPCRLCWQKFTLPSDGSGNTSIHKRRKSMENPPAIKLEATNGKDDDDDDDDNDLVIVPAGRRAMPVHHGKQPADPMVVVSHTRSMAITDDTDAFDDDTH